MESVQGLIEKIKVNIQEEKPEEEIIQLLLLLWGNNPEFDGQLADHLAMIPHVKTAKVLQRMLQVSNEKKVQKIIKRSLYRLKSKGIVLEEVQPRKEETILRPLQIEPPKGFANGYDVSWNRFLLLFIPHGGRRLTVLHGLVNDEKGLLNFSGGEISRKEFRSFFEKLQKASPTPVIEMEPSYVGFLLMKAYRLSLEKKGAIPQEFVLLKSEIERIKKEFARPLIYSHLDVEETRGDDHLLSRGGDLLKADLFYSWKIEEDLIQRYADEIREAGESKIVLHPTQKEMRFQGIYQKALSELFSGERKFLYKSRLEEMAYLLFKLGKEEEARLSLAVALDLEKPLNLIQPNPFLLQLILKSISTLLIEANEEKAKEPSLIVKP